MGKLICCAACLAWIFAAAPSVAADICEAVATRNVRAEENPESILKVGEKDGAITQYRSTRRTAEPCSAPMVDIAMGRTA
jgi:hypothetical protein